MDALKDDDIEGGIGPETAFRIAMAGLGPPSWNVEEFEL